MYLYEEISSVRKYGGMHSNIPNYVKENLNKKFYLREYQLEALENFIFYFENENLKAKPTQLLFHMATGSGKTLMMAALIIYLYKKGYRNFLFFVNSTNIIEKTKENFLSSSSFKYLFNSVINVDSDNISIKEVSNFQNSDKDNINICFSTIQGLHMDLNFTKEDRLTFEDFKNEKVVLISDEAHHLNSVTSSGKIDKEESELLKTWEYTVNRLFHMNNENVLLEFTATCDTENDYIKSKYMDKIIFNYPLSKFREDGYSKEVETLQTETNIKNRMLQAILISQYRLKVFQDFKINQKPVILFKSDTINNSKDNMNLFNSMISSLTEEDINLIKMQTNNEFLMDMFIYFEKKQISISNLIRELKDSFSREKCISVNNDGEAYETQLIVNSLENEKNLYRAIFEVKKLDEGWDVLNLFDIVRLYDTRDGKNGKPGKKTVQEAQLIGRGARYCPFKIEEFQDQYKRKYDNDLEHPLRICETLLYHCQYDSRYISELKIALKETGIIPEESKKINYKLKESFKKTDFYNNGLVFFNSKKIKSRNMIESIPESVRYKTYEYNIFSGKSRSEGLFDEKISFRSIDVQIHTKKIKIKEIAFINKNIVLSSLRRYPIYKFNTLKSYFPNLKTIMEFITSDNYLGNITIEIKSVYSKIPNLEYYNAVVSILEKIKDNILSFDEVYEGTKEFDSKFFNEIFKDKLINITNPGSDGIGISQKDVNNNDYLLDLSDEEWYVFNDNYGTTEEKKFVKYFYNYIEELNSKYKKIYLVRNERTLPIYSFENGERFEPDYLLILLEENESYVKQYQIFIEPKGSHLLISDKWKEELLLSLSKNSIPITKFIDNNDYLIWGFPFYNSESRIREFSNAMETIL